MRIKLRNVTFVLMKSVIEIFTELGVRLMDAPQNKSGQGVIAAACRQNPWFTPTDIKRALAALSNEMLQREKLERWLAAYPTIPVVSARNVLVIMAGNIPLVGFFDLLCVVASGHRCMVKPSSKDRLLMEYPLSILRQIEPQIPITLYCETETVDAVIATGSDNANRYFRAEYAAIPTLLRGTRQSVAVLSGEETERQLQGLADDIWAYSGLGCRNVSLLFLPEGAPLRLQMPDMPQKYQNNYRQVRAELSMNGVPFVDLGGAVLVEQRSFPTHLSELSYTYYRSKEEVAAWLSAQDDTLQCVVSESLAHSRQVGFGAAQTPQLTDYPDAKDVMAWLATIVA